MASTSSASMFSSLSLLSLSSKSNLSSLKPCNSLYFFKSQTLTSPRFARFRQRSTAVLASVDAPEAERKLHIGNIPRTVDNEDLTRIVEEHSGVEKAQERIT